MNVLDLEMLFGPDGPLSKNLPYYEYRPSQIEYARAVQSAFEGKKIALVEAQTGTGKTLAYLIPALQTGRRVIISTGTKALQEQLVYKDIPLLREKLGIEFESLLMKGRMNYLCLLKQERLESEPLLPDQESVGHFETIRKWSSETDTGDLAESGVSESAPILKQLSISADACLGSKCRYFNQCFVFKLKQRADLNEAESLQVIQKAIKKRKEAAELYEKGGRPELAAKENAEAKILEAYVPAAMDEATARQKVAEVIQELGVTDKKEMGRVMKEVLARYRGQLDGKLAQKLVNEILQ